MNDALDDAVKQTRRSMGRKIRKEVLVALAIETMLKKVEAVGGVRSHQRRSCESCWGKYRVDSVGEFRRLLRVNGEKVPGLSL